MENILLHMTIYIQFILYIMLGTTFTKAAPVRSTTIPHRHCHRHMMTKVNQCLARFEQMYLRYTDINTTNDFRNQMIRLMCNEYETSLMCLHLLIQTCPPTAWHGDNIRERIGLVHLHMDKLCFQSPPTTTTSASTAQPTKYWKKLDSIMTTLASTVHKSTLSNSMVTEQYVAKTTPNLVIKKTDPTKKGFKDPTIYVQKSTVTPVEYKHAKFRDQKSQKASVTTVNNLIKIGENKAKFQDRVTLHINMSKSACSSPYINIHFVIFSTIVVTIFSR